MKYIFHPVRTVTALDNYMLFVEFCEGVSKIYDAVVVVESYSKGQLSSSGTGFVYKKDNDKAYIITNCHVVSGASSVKIVNMNNESVEAKVLGSDEYEDVAVLQIDANYALAVSEIGSRCTLRLFCLLGEQTKAPDFARELRCQA